ncbi:hypothetical protein CBR_g51045 [Chara braunii]|uniref:Uncharacterized protein n=1 Tax=Chara braunii TaxID=69332 RepID=A0A388K5X2_CHABU|nr:hypothetical protein CBR_g51045 [Chara braunii]|eukprot:GBG65450.1 hypothetical protein CBR_g51045 [Chara braunii]
MGAPHDVSHSVGVGFSSSSEMPVRGPPSVQQIPMVSQLRPAESSRTASHMQSQEGPSRRQPSIVLNTNMVAPRRHPAQSPGQQQQQQSQKRKKVVTRRSAAEERSPEGRVKRARKGSGGSGGKGKKSADKATAAADLEPESAGGTPLERMWSRLVSLNAKKVTEDILSLPMSSMIRPPVDTPDGRRSREVRFPAEYHVRVLMASMERAPCGDHLPFVGMIDPTECTAVDQNEIVSEPADMPYKPLLGMAALDDALVVPILTEVRSGVLSLDEMNHKFTLLKIAKALNYRDKLQHSQQEEQTAATQDPEGLLTDWTAFEGEGYKGTVKVAHCDMLQLPEKMEDKLPFTLCIMDFPCGYNAEGSVDDQEPFSRPQVEGSFASFKKITCAPYWVIAGFCSSDMLDDVKSTFSYACNCGVEVGIWVAPNISTCACLKLTNY